MATKQTKDETARLEAERLQAEINELKYQVHRADYRYEWLARRNLETAAMLLAETAFEVWKNAADALDTATADVLLRFADFLRNYREDTAP